MELGDDEHSPACDGLQVPGQVQHQNVNARSLLHGYSKAIHPVGRCSTIWHLFLAFPETRRNMVPETHAKQEEMRGEDQSCCFLCMSTPVPVGKALTGKELTGS